MKDLLQFHQLEKGIDYRLLHGGERDHGYNYRLTEQGTLYNMDKNRVSSVPFNLKTRFIRSDRKIMTFDSLEFNIEFHSKGLKIGCQNINLNDARQIAQEILARY